MKILQEVGCSVGEYVGDELAFRNRQLKVVLYSS